MPYTIQTQPATFAVPKVLLTRWLPIIGVDGFWAIVAIRQDAHHEFKAARVSASELAGRVAMSKRRFWRAIETPYFSWLADSVGKSPLKTANRYRVPINPPLTPADLVHLRAWLAERIEPADAESGLVALKQALETPRADLLAPDPAAASDETKPQTIKALVLALTPAAEYSTEAKTTLDNLCTQLYDHLYLPFDDVMLFSQYFLRAWLPILGSAKSRRKLALIYLTVKDQCFDGHIKDDNGQRKRVYRDTVWIGGGYAALSKLVGANRQTISRWFDAIPGSGAEHISHFLKVLGTRRRGRKAVDVLFQVTTPKSEYEPLTPSDERRHRDLLNITTGGFSGTRSDVLADSQAHGQGTGGFSETRSDALTDSQRHGQGTDGFSETRSDALTDSQRHGRGALVDSQRHLIKFFKYKFQQIANLNPKEKIKTDRQTSSGSAGTTSSSQDEHSRQTDGDVSVCLSDFSVFLDWDLPTLLNAAGIDGDKRERALASGRSASEYVSRLLFALSRGTFTGPALWAAMTLAGEAREQDGYRRTRQQFDEFASLGPVGLAICLYAHRQRSKGYHEEASWGAARRFWATFKTVEPAKFDYLGLDALIRIIAECLHS